MVEATIVSNLQNLSCTPAAEAAALPDVRFDISIQEADSLVRWIIPYYAFQTSREKQGIISRKYLELYTKLEPSERSKYHELWVRSHHDAILKLKGGQVGE